uniref:Tail fiber protein n=1 Tax=Burkholderia phage vB_BgluM-SURPRISE13 TaxID=3159457 RepID=A0AAU7PFP5_9VIRU
MQDALLLKKKMMGGGGLNSIPPLWGWNYSSNVSTGTVTPISHTAGAPVTPPISIAGYTTAVKGIDTVTYAAGSRTSTQDFTAMTRVLLVGATGYAGLLGSTFTFRTGDAGFGNRIQFGYAMSTIATCWDSSVTESQMSSAWYHLAMVRKANVNTVYINGSAIMLANGTGSTYNNPSFSDATSMINNNVMTVGQSGLNVYTAEWGFWDSAIITSNFTPPVGGLV